MELDFSDLALAKFLQSFPELGNTILTFKDLSNELQDDTGIKVGVFILRVGTETFFVPSVSKDENVYPLDSIFFSSKSKFFPLTKKTIGLVLNSAQLSPGKAKKIPTNITQNPDLSTLINPPRTGKYVSASTSRLGDFMASMPQYLKGYLSQEYFLKDSMDSRKVQDQWLKYLMILHMDALRINTSERLNGWRYDLDTIDRICDRVQKVRALMEKDCNNPVIERIAMDNVFLVSSSIQVFLELRKVKDVASS